MEDANPYELLGIEIDSTESQIKTAYRQRSLKVHPDRHPNNPEAAQKFHELNQAYELLLDPIRKSALDVSLKIKLERKVRYAAFDTKRKGMQEDLEERERAFKRAKVEKEREKEQLEVNEKIKEEGRKLREERKKEAEKVNLEQAYIPESTESRPELGPLDTTIKIKYPLSAHPSLTDASTITALLRQFGPIDSDSIVISMKGTKKAPNKPPRFATALVPFKNVGDAFGAVCATGRKERGLDSIEISWASGQEPAILGWFKNTPLTKPPPPSDPSTASHSSAPSAGSPFPSFPSSFPFEIPSSTSTPGTPGLDFESITLMRLRQAERQKLEKNIREEEAETEQEAGT